MRLLYFFESLRTPFWDKFFLTITTMGDEVFFIAIALMIFWCINKNAGYYLMTTCFFGATLNQILKLSFRVPRPWVLDPNFSIVEAAREAATGYSFPSGHTQNAVAVFGCIAENSGKFSKKNSIRKLICTVCFAFIILVALSRLYLGVHTSYDVAVSIIISAVLVIVFKKIFDVAEKKPYLFYIIIASMLLVSIIYVIFAANQPADAAHALENVAAGQKYSWYFLGAITGIAAAYPLEKHFVNFETKAPFWVQVIKLVVGLVLVVMLKSVLKAPLSALFGGHLAAHGVRYFVVVFFAIFVWPASFRLFPKKTK